jgi:hypothetical protein
MNDCTKTDSAKSDSSPLPRETRRIFHPGEFPFLFHENVISQHPKLFPPNHEDGEHFPPLSKDSRRLPGNWKCGYNESPISQIHEELSFQPLLPELRGIIHEDFPKNGLPKTPGKWKFAGDETPDNAYESLEAQPKPLSHEDVERLKANPEPYTKKEPPSKLEAPYGWKYYREMGIKRCRPITQGDHDEKHQVLSTGLRGLTKKLLENLSPQDPHYESLRKEYEADLEENGSEDEKRDYYHDRKCVMEIDKMKTPKKPLRSGAHLAPKTKKEELLPTKSAYLFSLAPPSKLFSAQF